MSLVSRLKNWRNPHNETRIHLERLSAKYGFEIGRHSYGRPKVRFPESKAKLTIGPFCSIADKVEILLGGNHRTDWVSTFPFAAFPDVWPEAGGLDGYHATRGDVWIGSDVWLGSGAIILSGVKIGHGAVVAAHAVVTRDVPPYGIVGGNPARTLRLRFDEETVAGLIETAWWDLDDALIRPLLPLLQSGGAAKLIERVREIRRSDAGTPAAGPPSPASP